MSNKSLITDLTSQRIEGWEKYKGEHFSIPLFSHIFADVFIGGTPRFHAPAEFKFFINLYDPFQYQVARGQILLFCQLDDSHDIPDQAQLSYLVEMLERFQSEGPTLIHCQAGLNRSSLIAALWLIRRGHSPDQAISLIRAQRSPVCLCNPAFETYLRAKS